jgi:hypothetical protein
MLVGVIVWSDGDKIHIGKDASETLSDFKSYCDAHLDIKFHDSAHLMTYKQFSSHIISQSMKMFKIHFYFP